jgi:hypothetical protein
MRRLTRLTTIAAVLPVLLVAGCGGETDTAEPSPSSSPSSTPSSTLSGTPTASSSAGTASPAPDTGVVVDVTIKGDKVTPNGERLEAEVGKPVTLRVTSDQPGELHVHSTPEQELEYGAGRTTLQVTVDKPGIVDVEDHAADVVVVQLEVS